MKINRRQKQTKGIKAFHLKGVREQSSRIYSDQGLCPTLSTMQGGGQVPKIISPNVISQNFKRHQEKYSIHSSNKREVTGAAILDDQGRKHASLVPQKFVPTLRAQTHGNLPKVILPILTPDKLNKRQNGRRIKRAGEPMFTLTAQDRHGVILSDDAFLCVRNGAKHRPYLKARNGDNINLQLKARGTVKKGYTSAVLTSPDGVVDRLKIRKLTPLECWRLQGLPGHCFLSAATGRQWNSAAAKELDAMLGISAYLATLSKDERLTSDSQLYKQAGNSVSVPVIEAIARRLV